MEIDGLTMVEKRTESLQKVSEAYESMSRFLERTREEKGKTVDTLKKLDALIKINIESVRVRLMV